MIKKTLLTLLAATSLSALPAMAQEAPTPAAPTPAATTAPALPADADPALWVVKDADTTIYLFGTVHLLRPGMTWLDEAVADAYTASDELVFELPEGEDEKAQQVTMALGMLPADQSLRAMLPEEDKAAYEAAMTKIGLPVEAFDRFKPWFAAVTLGILPLMKAGYDVNSGSEKQLSAKAKADGKVMAGLETVEYQLGIFDGLSNEAQIAYLRSVTTNIDQVGPMMDGLLVKWAQGDADGLAELMNAGFSDPAMYEALLTRRNMNWAEWIDTRLDQPGRVFMAVGAGHLAGQQSVQKQLEARGIASERINY